MKRLAESTARSLPQMSHEKCIMAVSSSDTRVRRAGGHPTAGHGSDGGCELRGVAASPCFIPLVTSSPSRVNRKLVEAGTTVPTDFGEKVRKGLVRISIFAQACRANAKNCRATALNRNWH